MRNEENEKWRTRDVIETNGGMQKGNRGKEEKSHIDNRVAVRVLSIPDSCDISSLICLWTCFPDDQES